MAEAQVPTNSDTAADSDDPTRAKYERVQSYLKQYVEDRNGEAYLKSKTIANGIELSAKEIGAQMKKLQASAEGLSVEKWAYSSATTWRVRLA